MDKRVALDSPSTQVASEYITKCRLQCSISRFIVLDDVSLLRGCHWRGDAATECLPIRLSVHGDEIRGAS